MGMWFAVEPQPEPQGKKSQPHARNRSGCGWRFAVAHSWPVQQGQYFLCGKFSIFVKFF